MPSDLRALANVLDFGVELGVGEAANLAGLALPDERGFLGACAERVPVDTIVAEVDFAADEPLGPGQIPFKNLVPRLEPMQFFRHAGPEFFGIVDGLLVEGFIFGEALDMGLGRELGRWRKDAVFAQRGVDIAVGDGSGRQRHAGSFSGECCECIPPLAQKKRRAKGGATRIRAREKPRLKL